MDNGTFQGLMAVVVIWLIVGWLAIKITGVRSQTAKLVVFVLAPAVFLFALAMAALGMNMRESG